MKIEKGMLVICVTRDESSDKTPTTEYLRVATEGLFYKDGVRCTYRTVYKISRVDGGTALCRRSSAREQKFLLEDLVPLSYFDKPYIAILARGNDLLGEISSDNCCKLAKAKLLSLVESRWSLCYNRHRKQRLQDVAYERSVEKFKEDRCLKNFSRVKKEAISLAKKMKRGHFSADTLATFIRYVGFGDESGYSARYDKHMKKCEEMEKREKMKKKQDPEKSD